jgi:hypothetical protein
MICLSKRIEKERDSIEQLVDFSGGVYLGKWILWKKNRKRTLITPFCHLH